MMTRAFAKKENGDVREKKVGKTMNAKGYQSIL